MSSEWSDSNETPRRSSTKTILIVVATVAILFGGLIVSCVAIVGYSAWRLLELPEHVTVENLESHFSDEIELICNRIDKRRALEWNEDRDFGERVLAIYRSSTHTSGRTQDWRDIYRKHETEPNGYTLHTRVGSGRLFVDGETRQCVLYRYSKRPSSYVIWFDDTIAPPGGSNDRPK